MSRSKLSRSACAFAWIVCLHLSAMLAAASGPTTRQAQTLLDAGEALEIAIPFYEGIVVRNPVASLPQAGLGSFQLSYPGPLSAPFVAWRQGHGDWTVMYADSLTRLPTALDVAVKGNEIQISLTAQIPCSIQQMTVNGSWESMARGVRRQWKVNASGVRLAERFDRINFYVNQWVSEKADPPLRVDWSVDQLKAEMQKLDARTLVHLYGIDPGGVDLGGKCLWSEGAEANAKQIIASNPNVSHLAWLNLRTMKTAIPRLKQTIAVTDQTRGMAKLFDGHIRDDNNYSFAAIDMCLADERWQASRLREFDKLIALGFKVIQLDEFPLPPVWHVAPCGAADHLHRPNDAADEWDKSIAFVKRLSERAAKHGVILTCEEPSAALLPYVGGYIDRQYNDSIDLYWMKDKTKSIETAPIFSTMFADVVTPYTDTDGPNPARNPPAHWLQAHKILSK